MVRTAIRNVLGLLAFLAVWGIFPSQLLSDMGMGDAWVGLAKIVAAILAAWWVVGFRHETPNKPDA